MNLSVGIVGLPNVGKSTLFNALLKKQQALAANYPFATIEPNIGIVPVPDKRLEVLARITAEEMLKQVQHDKETVQNDRSKWPPIKPATVEFVDIAGLVKGASEGAGLGNKFLSHIREVPILAHVVRAFEDENVVREGSTDPLNDYKIVRTELELADLEKGGEISKKPEIVVLNVSEEDYTPEKIESKESRFRSLVYDTDAIVVICAKIESELVSLSEEEQVQYLSELGLQQSGLERLIQKAYQNLGLISFLTAGKKEVRAWTVQRGTKAVDAAGVIHTDFTKKFIKAEVVSYEDFVLHHGWKGSREAGKARLEGKDYTVKDGDVVEFLIGG